MADDINWNKTHCGRMDHGGCALLVGVKDNQIVDIKGDPDGYLNRGYICAKGRASADRLNHPQRLRHPLKRRGERGAGKWDPISWPQARVTWERPLQSFTLFKDPPSSAGRATPVFIPNPKERIY